MTVNDYVMGQPLKSGVKLFNKIKNTEEVVNLNEPKYIKELIVLGLKDGWSETNLIIIKNGLNYLSELGFQTDQLKPENNK